MSLPPPWPGPLPTTYQLCRHVITMLMVTTNTLTHLTTTETAAMAGAWDAMGGVLVAKCGCQGFIGRTPARVRDGSLPEGLNKYPAQLPRLGQLQTRVGSKSLVMQDYKQLPRLITALLRSGPNGSELPKMSPERAGTWPQLMCCASVL